MPNLANINARVVGRITNSGLTLTVVYPAVRPVAAGISPGIVPVNPLTGTPATDVVYPTEPAGYLSNVTLKCLWLDAVTGREATDVAHTELRKVLSSGWTVGATALARVLVSEAALDPDNIYAGTKLDSADHVVFRGSRYRVLQVIPIGASFGDPVTYHVWLKGMRVD